MQPSIGRIVHYVLADDDVAAIRTERRRSNDTARGTPVHVGEVVALLVTAVWPYVGDGRPEPCVNGQALLDGNDSLWVTMAAQGSGPGCWDWPPRATSIDLATSTASV